MEQIVRREGKLYYGDILCRNAEEAYDRFRRDYHRSIGKAVYRRLDRYGHRVERVHGFGFYRDEPYRPTHEIPNIKVPYVLLGLIGTSYVRMIERKDIPVDDEALDDWLEVALTKGSGLLRLTGRKSRTGRTSKRLKRRYR